HLTIGEQDCAASLKKLIQKNILEIKELKNKNNQLSEAYSFEPLWEKLFTEETPSQKQEEGDLFLLFEQEFGRPISPFEIETINFNYIDRMLKEWKKKGSRYVKQAKEVSRSFRTDNAKKEYQKEERDTSVYFNWLKGE